MPDELLAFEREILAALLSKGEYSGSIDNDRLSMVAGEIFDTILITNVPVAHYKLLEVQTKIHDGRIAIGCAAALDFPAQLGIGVQYGLQNYSPEDNDIYTFPKLELVRDSLKVDLDQSQVGFLKRGPIAVMNIPGMVARELSDPATIVSKTLTRRFDKGYGTKMSINAVGMHIADNSVEFNVHGKKR